MLARILSALVSFSSRRAWPITALSVALGAASVAVATRFLSIDTNEGDLFAQSLPWQKAQHVLDTSLPREVDQLVAVVDGDTPEEAAATASQLADRLSSDTTHFRTVWTPDLSTYGTRNGLLFLQAGELGALLERTIAAQPLLGQLAADPSMRGLCRALSLIAQGQSRGEVDLRAFAKPLIAFADNLDAAAQCHPAPLSWQRLLSGVLGDAAGRYRFVVTQPRLDFGSLQPGRAATVALRQAASALEFVKTGGARVRVTGQVALDDEEFETVAQGMVTGLLGSLALVALWLILAVRSCRIVVPILVTLMLGLVLTLGFAAITVGTLNLISVAFAVLFVGLAVDFAIQFSVRTRAQVLACGARPDIQTALVMAAREAGGQILIAALATACGFLAFTPTAFVGVAQLGLIAGAGMLIALVCTLTILPALLTLCRPNPVAGEVGFGWARPLDAGIRRHRVPILAGFGALGLAGAACIPLLHFDSDPLHTKSPHTESMRTLSLLMADPVTSPYSAELLAPDLAMARTLVQRLEKLDTVQSVISLDSFVPTNQAAKLAMIADAAALLLPSLAVATQVQPPDALAIRAAMQQAVGSLAPVVQGRAGGDPIVRVAAALRALVGASDAALLADNAALTRFLPSQLDQLRASLSVDRAAAAADLPRELRERYLLPDGRVHVEVFPAGVLRPGFQLSRFAYQVRSVWPDASGSAVSIVESARSIIRAFRFAIGAALGAIALVLIFALRRPLLAGLVFASLLMSSLLTLLLAVSIGVSLNFANIIVLPLLLGVGVSFNIYFVMNHWKGMMSPLSSPTGRAVLFSALLTGSVFGSLAMSHHPGTASMGTLLLLGMFATTVTTFFFQTALLACLDRTPARTVGPAFRHATPPISSVEAD